MHYVKSVKTIGIDFLHVIVEAVKYENGQVFSKQFERVLESVRGV